MFGQDFENYVEPEEDAAPALPAPVNSAPNASATDKAKKGKVQAKATGHKYQFQIMESIGVPRADIKKFADPLYWLKYFPPIAIEDQKSLGTVLFPRCANAFGIGL